jgi:coenzyme PQQ precursor peptide PqqA
MAVHGAGGKQRQAEERTTCWNRPDFQAIETSMEVTAYFVAKG